MRDVKQGRNAFTIEQTLNKLHHVQSWLPSGQAALSGCREFYCDLYDCIALRSLVKLGHACFDKHFTNNKQIINPKIRRESQESRPTKKV